MTVAPEPVPRYQPKPASPVEPTVFADDTYSQEFDEASGYAHEPIPDNDFQFAEQNPGPEVPQRENFVSNGQELQNHPSTQQWEQFVRFMESTSDKSLVSLLRNSVLLKITEDSLEIGLQNTALFSEEKRNQIELSAKEFFKRTVAITYRNSIAGIDDSVRIKQEQEKLKQEAALKQAAAENQQVQQILSLFPKSKIISIEIVREKGDV